MSNLKRLSALAATAIVAVVATAQLTPPTGKKPTLRGLDPLTTSRAAEAPMNRRWTNQAHSVPHWQQDMSRLSTSRPLSLQA